MELVSDLGFTMMKRREFTKLAGLGAVTMHIPMVHLLAGERAKGNLAKQGVPLGLCDWSLHMWGWRAQQYLDFAVRHQLDAILFNSHSAFEQLDDNYLNQFRDQAAAHNILIYMGVGSITNENARFMKQFGSAEALLAMGIRAAAAVGSPVVSCRIGSVKDRYTDGGIGPKIEKAIRVMRSLREQALEAGIRFAFENHAGDLRTDELIRLIEETGTDICGALFDPANAAWAMEDPMESMVKLGSLIICTSVRDFNLWETDTGAAFQNTSIGKGLMDYDMVMKYMAEHCPGVPLNIETVSGKVTEIPYLTPGYWQGFPGLPAEQLTGFFRLLKKGKKVRVPEPDEGEDPEHFNKELQLSEFLTSLDIMRNRYGAGLK